MSRHLGHLARGAAAALAASVLLGAAPSRTAKPVLPFIQDDYARALKQARERKLPIFVESWAPW